jgi:hypothetical protein
MCLKSILGLMKDESGLLVVVNGAMYERFQHQLHSSSNDEEALSIQVCVVNSKSCADRQGLSRDSRVRRKSCR